MNGIKIHQMHVINEILCMSRLHFQTYSDAQMVYASQQFGFVMAILTAPMEPIVVFQMIAVN